MENGRPISAPWLKHGLAEHLLQMEHGAAPPEMVHRKCECVGMRRGHCPESKSGPLNDK